jgi:hypothetical protein
MGALHGGIVLEKFNQPPTFEVSRLKFLTHSLLTAAKLSERLLFDRLQQQQHHDRDGDRGQITNARQAAEALFAPKRQSFKEIDQEAAPPTGEPIRGPRVLTISPAVPRHAQELAVPIGPKKQVKPKISKSQFARIRAWRRYGMTAEQVAEVYGVTISEIEGILRMAR